MSELFADVEGVKVIVDDLLVWGKDDEEHDARRKQVLTRAREVNLKFNTEECKIKQGDVPFVGHVLRKEGLKPDPEKIRAVKEMKPPENDKELKTFLGFIQYLGKFMPNMATENTTIKRIIIEECCVAMRSPARRKLSEEKADGLLNTNPWLL